MATRVAAFCILLASIAVLCTARCSRSRPTKGCGRTMSSYRGTIKSPGFPNPYPPALTEDDQVCQWMISLPYGHGIKVYLYDYDFNFEPNDVSTAYDELQIFRDIACSEADRERTFVGNLSATSLIHLPSHWACIKFIRRTLQNIQHTGFSLSYEVIDANSDCGVNKTTRLLSEEGYIFSPGYSISSYPQDLECTWLVESQPGSTIAVTFLDFQLSYTYSCDFAADYVQIGNSNTSYAFKYCDSDSPQPFQTRDNRLWVFFKSGQWRHRGFWLYYKGSGDSIDLDRPSSDYWKTGSAKYEWTRDDDTGGTSFVGWSRDPNKKDPFKKSDGGSIHLSYRFILAEVIVAVTSLLTIRN
ncbi:CUB domain-containing protein 2-like [Branchiostoma lanceolatum]|uniref:CUB domain-containing protein 2-like n=1 Tax=Branchiostoma lanceolatum TaxID=7740 RepID=UPI003453C97A